jgi:dihydroorotate dehydrogenase
LAGASAVQVGTALLGDPGAAGRVIEELAGELAGRGLAGAADLVGQGHRIRQREDA